MGDRDSEMTDGGSVSGASSLSGVPPRTPQQGGSPTTKKVRNLPYPVPTTREALNFLRHTIEIEATRKSHMTRGDKISLVEVRGSGYGDSRPGDCKSAAVEQTGGVQKDCGDQCGGRNCSIWRRDKTQRGRTRTDPGSGCR